MWRIANCSADLYNSREISMHFVMKIIEIDSYSRRKLTQNQELSMNVIVLRRKAIKLGFHLNFLITVIKHTFALHPFLKIRCSGDILILKNQSKYSFPEFYSLFKSAVQAPFSYIFYKSTGIQKFLELLINILMSQTNNLGGNSCFLMSIKTFINRFLNLFAFTKIRMKRDPYCRFE